MGIYIGSRTGEYFLIQCRGNFPDFFEPAEKLTGINGKILSWRLLPEFNNGHPVMYRQYMIAQVVKKMKAVSDREASAEFLKIMGMHYYE